MKSRQNIIIVLISALLGLSCSFQSFHFPKPHPDLPDDFKKLLPRGVIPSVDKPKFVAAEDAEIPDDAWVIGVEVDGKARAYSLHLLNAREVVNDRIGEKNFAVVW